MARVDDRIEDDGMLLRIMEYGPAKSKKTWWIGKAAEANFNVLLLDGDDGWHILKQIKPEFQHRIQVVDVTDDMGSPVFAQFLARLAKSGDITWDEATKKSCKLKPTENAIYVNVKQMDANSVLVIDSWTALVRSFISQYAKENLIDLSIAEDGDDKWGFYAWAGKIASWILDQFTALPCHVIVIGHEDQYEKRVGKGKDAKVVFSKRQAKSTSGPHAMQLASQFSDVLYFYPKGSAFKIDASGDENRMGGSRIVPPKVYNWDDLQFKDLILAAGMELPTVDNPLIDYSLQKSEPKPATGSPLVKPVSKPTAKLSLGTQSK